MSRFDLIWVVQSCLQKRLRFRSCSNRIGPRVAHRQSEGASVPGCDIARRANLSHVPGIALSGKSKRCSRPSRTHKRGGSRSSRTLGAGCDGRTSPGAVLARRAAVVRTAKPCGPGAPTLALSSWIRSTDDGGKRARSPRRARRKPLKPSRRECRWIAVYLWLLTPVLFYCTGGHGCFAHPAFSAPLLISRAVHFQHLGHFVPRDRRVTPPFAVMPRECVAPSTRRPLGLITSVSGILDRRVKPGDDDRESGSLPTSSRTSAARSGTQPQGEVF